MSASETLHNLVIKIDDKTDVIVPECRTAITIHDVTDLGAKLSKTEKQTAVLTQVQSTAVRMLAATGTGKVAKMAREGLAGDAESFIASAAAKGNFTPLYEAIVLTSVKNVQPIRNMQAFEMARGFIRGMRDNLKNGGYSAKGTLSTEAKGLDKCLSIFAQCDDAIAAQKAADAERREKAKQLQQQQQQQPAGE